MPKTVRILVTDVEGEITIHDEDALRAAEMTEEDVREAFGNSAYWLTLTLKDCTFADQQKATREAGQDETLLPQKRFVVAVEDWRKQYACQEESSILPVTETAFTELKPPALANVINSFILAWWYPGATKTVNFIQAYQKKRAESGEAKKSTSSPSTPA